MIYHLLVLPDDCDPYYAGFGSPDNDEFTSIIEDEVHGYFEILPSSQFQINKGFCQDGIKWLTSSRLIKENINVYINAGNDYPRNLALMNTETLNLVKNYEQCRDTPGACGGAVCHPLDTPHPNLYYHGNAILEIPDHIWKTYELTKEMFPRPIPYYLSD